MSGSTVTSAAKLDAASLSVSSPSPPKFKFNTKVAQRVSIAKHSESRKMLLQSRKMLTLSWSTSSSGLPGGRVMSMKARPWACVAAFAAPWRVGSTTWWIQRSQKEKKPSKKIFVKANCHESDLLRFWSAWEPRCGVVKGKRPGRTWTDQPVVAPWRVLSLHALAPWQTQMKRCVVMRRSQNLWERSISWQCVLSHASAR